MWLVVTILDSTDAEPFHHHIGSCGTVQLWTIQLALLSHLLLSRDGRVLAAGGKSNHLHLWCLEAKQLFRIIQMPSKVRAIRHLEFLPDSFDAGSNQVGNITQDILRVEKDHTTFWTVIALSFNLYPDCYKDLKLLISWEESKIEKEFFNLRFRVLLAMYSFSKGYLFI